VLGACLQAAVFYRYADSNAVRELPPAQRPRPERKEAAYFENQELPRLFWQLRKEPYRTLCLVALKTGMRQGELVALLWGRCRSRRGGYPRPVELHGRDARVAEEP
jgi:integrase